MKKILMLISISFLGISGCKKGLEAQLPGTLNPTTFPKTEADYQSLVTGIYKLFGSKWTYSDGGITGDLFFGVEFSNIFLNDYPTDGIAYFPEWGGFFDSFSKADFNFMRNLAGRRNHLEKIRFITKITKIIADVNAATVVSADSKVAFEAEARAARGILMYHLLTMYGPVPYIDDPDLIGNSDAEANMKRPDRSTYVARVAEDLQFAATNLVPEPAEYGRFNKGCALTYLMRLYLFEKDWSNAEQTGRELLKMNYQLVDNYSSLFKVATEKNTETIWAISCDPAANGNNNLGNMNAWTFYTYSADYPGNISAPGEPRKGGWASPAGAFTATWYFYDTFDPTDTRRALLIPSYNPINSSGVPTGAVKNRENGLRGPVINKYPDDDPTAFAGNDIPICRYADVLLMMAEAINEQQGPVSEAQGLINQVRNRANLLDLEGADIASTEAFRDAILRERGWELFFEGQRRIDLVRMGKFTQILTAAGKTPQPGTGLFPVPQYMLDWGMEQTPGY
ncbi:RagB/SusD family nutrient uptake outer membrane protein [Parapedobacter tibetensis]|uniref:RagB/SusD family nutrient uptake outer membrane protein n=1 Tax=Parapedobacter tibetensis TaxID=2972951 RepID=UPI00214D2713|nr:RagB/SusD family nutrient uptake outer membrane protein [Parapedobacter tibetensis]